MEDGIHRKCNEGFVGNIYPLSNPDTVYITAAFSVSQKNILPNKAVDLTRKSIEEIYKSVKAGHPVVINTRCDILLQ